MFTGIIEEKGQIKQVTKTAKSLALTISANKIMNDIQLGDSIAINGICFTVKEYDQQTFAVDAMLETLSKTTFQTIKSGEAVNLERALTLNSRLGGHLVSGHIDGTGVIKQIQQEGIAKRYTIATSPDILNYTVSKGSITIDGISLTVTDVSSQYLEVSVIPHTLEMTTLLTKTVGTAVNLEIDYFAKYIEKFIQIEHANTDQNDRLKKMLTNWS